jgi:hypothetical protein
MSASLLSYNVNQNEAKDDQIEKKICPEKAFTTDHHHVHD